VFMAGSAGDMSSLSTGTLAVVSEDAAAAEDEATPGASSSSSPVVMPCTVLGYILGQWVQSSMGILM
jgi:hypothetical protein